MTRRRTPPTRFPDADERAIVEHLHMPETGDGIARRRFLQGAIAAGGLTALDLSFHGMPAEAGEPLGPDERVLVLVYLAGGNDGLNTLIPSFDGTYHSKRGSLAIAPGAGHAIGGGYELHPNLGYLADRYRQGDVAIVQGVGEGSDDRSHFASAARWMAAQDVVAAQPTGWVGRYLDELGSDGFAAVSIGDNGIPLHLRGSRSKVTALNSHNRLFGLPNEHAFENTLFDWVSAMDQSTVSPGLHDSVRDVMGLAVATAREVGPVYADGLPEDRFSRRMALAARSINLDLGTRVVGVELNGFDTHASQLPDHPNLLAALDAGLRTFFETLEARFEDRVCVMSFSEFGRRVERNDSDGTDHGTASCSFVIGSNVRGGRTGQQPSLTNLDWRGDMKHTVDFRSLYASVLDGWLGADDREILGGNHEKLQLFNAPVDPARVADGRLIAVIPDRVADSRSSIGVDTAIGEGQTKRLQIAGRGGVPSTGAGAVVLNVTVTAPTTAGYLTVFPSGHAKPKASNLNFQPGETVPNLVVAKLGTGGAIDVFNYAGACHVIADVAGWFPSSASCLRALTPARVLDTRSANGAAKSPVGQSSTIDVRVTGRGGVPSTGVGAVVLNVTATGGSADSYITVFPTGATRPNASNLNFRRGESRPNLVIAKVGQDGSISLYNRNGNVDLVADVLGWLPADDRYTPLVPDRLLDTRFGVGTSAAPVSQGGIIPLKVTGVGGVPNSGAAAVVLNVTATGPSAGTYVTVWPNSESRPTASNLNVRAGQTIANLVVAKVGRNGVVNLYNYAGSTHLIADVMGWFS